MLEQTEIKPHRNLFKSLASALNIRPNEAESFMLLLGQAFFLGVAMGMFYTAANALFLAEYGAEFFPYIYIVAAVTITLTGVVFSRLERLIPFSFLLAGTVVFLIVTVTALWAGMVFVEARWLVFVVMVWMRLLWVITNLVLWALIGRLFNVQQGKRLFSLIMVGPVLAFIVVGLSTSLLVGLLGTVHLLLIAGVALIPALGLQWITLGKLPATSPASASVADKRPDEQADKTQSVWSLFQNKYIRILFVYTAIGTIGSYVLDFAFVTEAGNKYTDSEALSQFFGNYLGVSTIFLLFLAVVSGRLFDRYGAKAGVIFPSEILGAGVVAMAVTSTLFGPITAVFWLTVGTRLMDDVLLVTQNAARNLIYQPLQDAQRVRVQTIVESIITPLFVGVSGVILLLFNALANLSIIYVYYLLVVVLVVRLWYSFALSREYEVTLKQAVTRRRFAGAADTLAMDKLGIEVLQQGLGSARAGVVVYSLDTLIKSNPELLPDILPDLLEHPVPEVRLKALNHIEQSGEHSLLPLVISKLSSEEDVGVQGAILRTLVSLGQMELVAAYLDHAELPIQMGAMIGLIRHGGLEGTLIAGQKLLQMIGSPEPEERVMAAQIIGEVGVRTFYQPVAQLLDDENPQVQRAALRTAGQLNNPALWPLVIDKLHVPQVTNGAVAALVSGSTTVLPELARAFAEEVQLPFALIQLARVLGRIGGAQAIDILRDKLDFSNEAVRTQVLWALSRCNYQPDNVEMITPVQQQIRAEAAHAAWLLNVVTGLDGDEQPDEAVSFLQTGLLHHMGRARSRMFYLLSFIYDQQAIREAQNVLNASFVSEREKANAIEVVDVLLSQELKKIVLPLLKEESSARQLQALKASFPQQQLTLDQHLQTLLKETDGQVNNWLKACALYVAGKLSRTALAGAVEAALPNTDPLIRETAEWALHQLQAKPAGRKPETLRKTTMLSTIERVLFLKRIDLFDQVPGEDLIQVAQVAQEVNFAPDDKFIQQGTLGNCLYIIINGTARIVLEDGTQVGTLGAEDVIGEMAILASRPRTANAIATTEVTALKIEQTYFQDLLAEKPELALGIIKLLVQRLEEVNLKVAQ